MALRKINSFLLTEFELRGYIADGEKIEVKTYDQTGTIYIGFPRDKKNPKHRIGLFSGKRLWESGLEKELLKLQPKYLVDRFKGETINDVYVAEVANEITIYLNFTLTHFRDLNETIFTKVKTALKTAAETLEREHKNTIVKTDVIWVNPSMNQKAHEGHKIWTEADIICMMNPHTGQIEPSRKDLEKVCTVQAVTKGLFPLDEFSLDEKAAQEMQLEEKIFILFVEQFRADL